MNPGCNGRAYHSAEVNPESMGLEASESFVLTPKVQKAAEKALSYLRAGYPVHFSGPAGTGKTTLALHVAALRSRPVTLMHGDDEFASSDLVGSEFGYHRSKLIDNFIHSVVKTEESMSTLWSDNRLTLACRNGDTLVYDEFTRSRPEANNALLSVLEERLLSLPKRRPDGEGCIEVHPEFRAIFTSNPEEYAGVHRTQDALMDRLITIKIDNYDRDTEIQISRAKSGIAANEAGIIVDIVRELRSMGVSKQGPSLRACIMISKITMQQNAHARFGDSIFSDICHDVLGPMALRVSGEGSEKISDIVESLIAKYSCEKNGQKKMQINEGVKYAY